jgi:hypothetical protein
MVKEKKEEKKSIHPPMLGRTNPIKPSLTPSPGA